MRFLVVSGVLFSFSLRLAAQQGLPVWQEGYMDLHHISTGRGNATFCVFPDGTTLLLDAGEISDTHPRTRSARNSALRPDTSRSAAEWLIDYIRQFHPEPEKPALDYALITHFHDDHFGEWDETRPVSTDCTCRLSGITAVGDQIPIRRLLDRGWHFPVDLKSTYFQEKYRDDVYHIVQTLREYWHFIACRVQRNEMGYDTIRPGASNQIVLKNQAEKYPEWQVRNIAANGRIWTGYKENDYYTLFEPGQYPGENPLSVCLKISYGPFDYFSGGDISGINELGMPDIDAVEAHVGPVIGPVDVAALNHHGNRDSQSPHYVRSLRPRVWVQQCWSSDHPGEEVLRRITSSKLYPGPRDLFTTDMLEANRLVIGERIINGYKNQHGHVVVRVFDRGHKYQVFVLNDYSTKREVLAIHGPYFSR
ncbi:MAG: MBL fold metallo-hydrolase [Saprospiraceae bacterium]|nr:MBL fold metallo-hydrolase [Saprospiraceae bacterium]